MSTYFLSFTDDHSQAIFLQAINFVPAQMNYQVRTRPGLNQSKIDFN